MAVKERVKAFGETLYEHGFVVVLDRGPWLEQVLRFMEAERMLASPGLLAVRKTLTTHERKERFCDGHLEGMSETGHLVAVLRRLQGIGEERAA